MVVHLRFPDSGPGRQCYYQVRDADVSELANDDDPDNDQNQHQSFVHVQGSVVVAALVTDTRTHRAGEMQLYDNNCKR